MPKITKAEVAANRKPEYEEVFEAAGVEYELTKISLSEVERHKQSQIRLSAANPARIAQYVARYKGGSHDVPPITVYQDGFPGYRVVDANHRVAMFQKLKVEEVWAYVLSGVNEEQSRWIGAALNGLHGVPLSAGEIKAGVEVGLSLDFSPETIARTIGASTSKVNRVIRIKKFDVRAAMYGLVTDGINDTMRSWFVNPAFSDESVFVAAVNLQRDAQMSTDEWINPEHGLIRKLAKAPSEQGRMDILTQARDDRDSAIKAVKLGKVARLSPVLTVRNLLLAGEKAMTTLPLTAWVPQGPTAPEWTTRVMALRDHLNTVLSDVEVLTGE